MVCMAFTLTFLKNIYVRYVDKESRTNAAAIEIANNNKRSSGIDSKGLLHNFSFLLSHIINQGNYLFAWIFLNS